VLSKAGMLHLERHRRWGRALVEGCWSLRDECLGVGCGESGTSLYSSMILFLQGRLWGVSSDSCHCMFVRAQRSAQGVAHSAQGLGRR